MFVYKSHHNDLIIIKHLLLRIKFPTKHLFWVFHFLKLLQWRHFVTYLWNNPRSLTCHTHAQPFYSSLDSVQDNPGELVPEETFTHSHLSWSSVIPYLLPPSITINGIPCSIYVPGSLFPQSLSKFSLVCLLVWHPQLHTPYISSPKHCLLFAAHAHTITTCFAVVPRLCHLNLVFLSQPFTSFNTTHPSNHSHLCPLKCHLIFLSYGPGLTSVQHTTLDTTAVQSPSHYQWRPIRILVSTAASAFLSTFNMSPK